MFSNIERSFAYDRSRIGGALTFALFVRHDLRMSAAHSANGTRGPVRSIRAAASRAIDAARSRRVMWTIVIIGAQVRRYCDIRYNLPCNVAPYTGRSNNSADIEWMRFNAAKLIPTSERSRKLDYIFLREVHVSLRGNPIANYTCRSCAREK